MGIAVPAAQNDTLSVIARGEAPKQSRWGGNEIATHLPGARNDNGGCVEPITCNSKKPNLDLI